MRPTCRLALSYRFSDGMITKLFWCLHRVAELHSFPNCRGGTLWPPLISAKGAATEDRPYKLRYGNARTESLITRS